ncbi:MAG: hypothetical protein IT204_11280 [Fimbriimonadaceae bacterium]|nr:hypothetical protein [Fimbriimonadaceae bacterium]
MPMNHELSPDPTAEPPLATMRLRALLVAGPLIAAMAYITVYGDMVLQKLQIGIMQLSPAALGGLFLLVLLSRLLKWLVGIRFLAARDLFPLYVVMTITVMMSSRGTIEKLIPPLIHASYYATAENQYMELFAKNLEPWLVVFDPEGVDRQDAAVDYHEGNAKVPWRLWLGPLLSWSGLLSLVYLSFLCLAVILRRQWADNEKLVFPLVTLPLALIDEQSAGDLFRNRLTWFGAALPVLVYTINGLHANIPSVPEIALSWNVNQFLTTKPWNGIYFTRVVISFGAVGFFYFLSSDLLFSLWFFFLVTRLTDVIATQLAYQLVSMPQYPTQLYIGYQVAGAYTVLVVYLLRTGWTHFGPVLRGAVQRGRSLLSDGANDEVIPYRVAVWGLLLSFLGSILWCWYAGLDAWLGFVELGVYLFVVALVLSRGVAEAGLLQTEASFRPLDLIRLVRPHWSLGARNITVLAMLDTVLTRDLRGVLLSNFLDNQKLARELRYRPRNLLLPIFVGVVGAMIAGCYFFLNISHDLGQISIYGYPRGNAEWQVKEAVTAMQQQVRTSPVALPSYLVGIVVCSGLVFLRATQVWWPLHPLGYAVCASWTLLVFWFSAFLTWCLKGMILKSGGMKAYRRAMPFFLGLVLGTFTMAFFWTLVCYLGKALFQVEVQAPSLGFD